MYWYTWVILITIIAAVSTIGIISSFLSGMQRGWRALIEQFPMDRAPEGDAFTGRSTMFVYAPGEKPKSYGCVAFFMPWTWKFPQSVRFASDATALHIMLDEGKIGPSSGVRIPFSELRLLHLFSMKIAYRFGSDFGDHALLRAGSCIISVPAEQFKNEIAILREMGQVEDHAPDDSAGWRDPAPAPAPEPTEPPQRSGDDKQPSWDDFRRG